MRTRMSGGVWRRMGDVAPRTAQAAMRHSKIDLTMNIYTDPKLLDVHGALDALPSLDLNPSPSTERAAMRATGTDNHDATANPRRVDSAGTTGKSFVAPPVAPNSGKRGQSVSFAVISSDVDDERTTRPATLAKRMKPSKKALPAVFAGKALEVEDNGVEPMTSCMPCTFKLPA